ncbi:MAG: hypothetical protein QM564_10750 [Bergeyella sp.]
MATISLKINEKSKVGQLFIAFLQQFVVNNSKAIEVIDLPNEKTMKSMANIEAGIGLTKTTSHEDLMKKLNS